MRPSTEPPWHSFCTSVCIWGRTQRHRPFLLFQCHYKCIVRSRNCAVCQTNRFLSSFALTGYIYIAIRQRRFHCNYFVILDSRQNIDPIHIHKYASNPRDHWFVATVWAKYKENHCFESTVPQKIAGRSRMVRYDAEPLVCSRSRSASSIRSPSHSLQVVIARAKALELAPAKAM